MVLGKLRKVAEGVLFQGKGENAMALPFLPPV